MPELLEDLCQRIGGIYLSDLRTGVYRPKAVELALELPAGAYPLEQWQDAAHYLLVPAEEAGSEEEVRRRLREALSGARK